MTQLICRLGHNAKDSLQQATCDLEMGTISWE